MFFISILMALCTLAWFGLRENVKQRTNSVCELDIMFNLEKAHMILDEMVRRRRRRRKRSEFHPFLPHTHDSNCSVLLLVIACLSTPVWMCAFDVMFSCASSRWPTALCMTPTKQPHWPRWRSLRKWGRNREGFCIIWVCISSRSNRKGKKRGFGKWR